MSDTPNDKPGESGKGKSVDGERQLAEDSRARGGGVELAATIEAAATELQELGSFNAMINRVARIRVLVLAEQVRGLEAVVQCWNAGKKCYEEKVDFATRQKCASWIAGYADGLPPQTNFNLNANANAKAGENMADEVTPASVEALERLLQRMKTALGAKEKRVLPAE